MTLSLCCSGKVFHVLRPDVDANCACRAASSQRGKVGWGETAESQQDATLYSFWRGPGWGDGCDGTRAALDTAVHPFHQGNTAEEIVSHYPALRPADGYAVISYCWEYASREQV